MTDTSSSPFETTWTDMTPAYIDMLLDDRHSENARMLAAREILRMARALDAYNGDAGKWDMENYRLAADLYKRPSEEE
jgi:hypothetical protein